MMQALINCSTRGIETIPPNVPMVSMAAIYTATFFSRFIFQQNESLSQLISKDHELAHAIRSASSSIQKRTEM